MVVAVARDRYKVGSLWPALDEALAEQNHPPLDAATRSARVVVPDYQLSLAIGKEGQNARLAAKLTGWRIDIRSDEEGAAPTAPGPTS